MANHYYYKELTREYDPGPSFIVITIYKDRGNVSSAVVCGDYPQHLTLTLKMAEAAIQKYESCNGNLGS